jgi:hypothetical protein
LIQTFDLSHLWVQLLSLIWFCIPWCMPKEVQGLANKRKQIREFVRDRKISVQEMPQDEDDNESFDFDNQERNVGEDLMDQVADVEKEDVFKKGPVPAEFAAVKRMAEHADVIEEKARILVSKNTTPHQLKEIVPELQVLLNRMKADAGVLQEEMPSFAAQEKLKDIAFNSISKLEVIPTNARPLSVWQARLTLIRWIPCRRCSTALCQRRLKCLRSLSQYEMDPSGQAAQTSPEQTISMETGPAVATGIGPMG